MIRYTKTECLNNAGPKIDNRFMSKPNPDLSDRSQVFKVDDIFTLWMDTWKFIWMEGDYTIYSVKWITKFSFICWNYGPDRFLVSHRSGIIRYMCFLRDNTVFTRSIIIYYSQVSKVWKLKGVHYILYPSCLFRLRHAVWILHFFLI